MFHTFLMSFKVMSFNGSIKTFYNIVFVDNGFLLEFRKSGKFELIQ